MADQDTIREAIESLGPGFELVRELGRGATAVVYLVRDHELDRHLAAKIIRSSFAHDDEAVARLQREARLVAQLQHPNIVRVFTTMHLPDGSLALLMEHVPGRNLKEVLLSTGPFSIDRTISVLRDVASALAYAHRRRIVHRDVKPENIYLDEEVGIARLADFGIARPWDRDARLTVPGEALGTPAYMSPEQIDGGEVDGRTDVYGLGLVGYEMLAGEHPWESDNLFNVIYKQKNERLPSLNSVRPDVPRDLVRLLEKALEKEKEWRWGSADALLQALESLRGKDDRIPARVPSPASTPPDSQALARTEGSRPQPLGAGRWRKRRLALVGLALLLPAAATWGWLTWGNTGREGLVSTSFGDGPATAPLPSSDPGSRPGDAPDVATTSVIEAVGSLMPSGIVGDSIPLAVVVLPPVDSATVVRFRVIEGEGVLGEDVATPDETGLARVGLRLPAQPGVTVVVAEVEGEERGQVSFDVLATAGPPQDLLAIWGEDQTGDPGTTLPDALGVRVVDRDGNPVPDAEVRFQVLLGNGTVAPTRVRTDTLGRAFALWSLGGSAGDQRVAALATAAEDATVVFQATASPSVSPEPAGADPRETPVAANPAAQPSIGVDVPPSTPPNIAPRPLAVGGTHACVIGGSGFASCMGARDRGQSGAPSAVEVRFVALAAGVSHTCGLDPTGQAYCWGANDGGQLGSGDRTDRPTVAPVETSTLFARLALGLAHSCGLDSSGQVICWGRNTSGQLGDGTRQDRTTPVMASIPVTMSAFAAGWNHTCAVAAGSGQAYCWGLNAEGQLGEGSRVDRVVPTAVSGSHSFSEIAAGNAHTCGLSAGAVFCWGANGSGQLGIGQAAGQSEPVRLEALPGQVTQLVAGAVHTCALLQNGQAWCWGQNIHGQLGDGTNVGRSLPTAVEGDLVFRRLEAGGGATCGVTDGGETYCWGLNQSGQLGDGTRTNRAVPSRVGS
jgi:tRNA A-37 threonylcarbamoyl transferase component Bud32